MKKRNLVFSLILLSLMLGVMVWRNKNSFASTRASVTAETNASSKGSKKDMYEMIDEKAKKVSDSDEASIRDLADTIFNENGASDLSPMMISSLKDSLVKAEMKYRKTGEGVRETNITNTFNYLADKFGAPDYARTSSLQVRLLRVKLMPLIPNLIAVDIDKEHKGLKRKIGSTINPEVSPLEATIIIIMMIHQKMLNEEWQVSPEEFALKRKDQYFKKRGPFPPEHSSEETSFSVRQGTEKSEEMRQIVQNRVAKMSLRSAEEMANNSLKQLGIEK